MTALLADIEVPPALAGMRRHALDGALLLFDRTTGINARVEGAQTRHLRQSAPRVVQLAITNHCNLRCGFCSRDLASESRWTAGDAFVFSSELADAGVLEVAFGGGEPLVFPGFDELLARLWDETPLAVNLTTNGVLLGRERVRRWHDARGFPRYGQIRVSLYDDNDWRATITMLADQGARFGVNVVVFPEVAARIEDLLLELAALGCRDVVLLAYCGPERQRHLDAAAAQDLAGRVRLLARALGPSLVLKLDVCWGSRMAGVPQLFPRSDCGAGREFITVTSDRRLMSCSFHHESRPFANASEALALWREHSGALASAARIAGCARVPGFGLDPGLVQLRLEGAP